MLAPSGNYYGSPNDAAQFFSNRLHFDRWFDNSQNDQVRALIQATLAIDRLNFNGTQTTPGQPLQFPRGPQITTILSKSGPLYIVPGPDDYDSDPYDQTVPSDIIMACYLCAYQFICGFDMEKEIENLNVRSQGFVGTRTIYNRDNTITRLRCGIPSAEAWNLLYPYLRDPDIIYLNRV